MADPTIKITKRSELKADDKKFGSLFDPNKEQEVVTYSNGSSEVVDKAPAK